ncbi:NEAT domain-containing protein [Paenibacillus yanchengensis]|uniref:NEAT domain-containing protein n=1 Tax=Paenibacillus yanchengensis TaxID=2035833 RepID=A0ABW4YPF5_9BACL
MLLICFTLLSVSLVIAPQVKAESLLADGSYYIDYVVLQADNDSVSIANDYFLKKAALFLQAGKQHVEIDIKNSKWVTSLQLVDGDSVEDVAVIAEDVESDSRKVAFFVPEDLSEPVFMKMHVQIPELSYDHKYTVRFKFDPQSVETADLTPSSFASDNASKASSSFSSTVVYVIVALVVLAAIVWIVARRNRKQ